ncbi:MAG: tetratricopeptide repeat protein [Flavobacteriales bacterium]
MSEESTDPRMEQFLRDAFAQEDVHRFRQVLREVATDVEARHGADEAPVIPLWRKPVVRWMAAAAVVALLVTAALPYLSPVDQVQLALDYTERSEGQLRGANPSVDAQWAEVRKALHEKRPDDALQLLQEIPASGTCDQARVHWYTALAQLMQEQKDQARAELEQVLASGCQEKVLARELLDEL